jgi:hypothetical protein
MKPTIMYWWEKNTAQDLHESYHNDEQDAKEFASQGLHKEAAMLFNCAAQQRIQQAKLNYSAGLDNGHFQAWEYCKKQAAKHEWLAETKK